VSAIRFAFARSCDLLAERVSDGTGAGRVDPDVASRIPSLSSSLMIRLIVLSLMRVKSP